MITAKNIVSELIARPFAERRIRAAFHDIDGTHSLIRNWPPVMSIVLWSTLAGGLPEGYDSEENVLRLAELAGRDPHPETDEFCRISAGLSALTQMEWGIRRGIDEGSIDVPCNRERNREILHRIYQGEELFEGEEASLAAFLQEHTPRLFRFYEKVLNAFCRDRNLKMAREAPEEFLVKGSMAFLQYLHDNGVKNYFVTGAVVEKGKGMHEEVTTLGFSVGKGCIIEDVIGSTWDTKLPKELLMKRLGEELGLCGEELLITGDGRSEIATGVKMGALCLSRLPADATAQRALHRALGTNIIVEDYLSDDLYAIFTKEGEKWTS